MERFESIIENVGEINIKGYGDLEMRERVIEVCAKSDDDKEYVYKFRGACAGVNRLYELIKENEKLKVKSKGISDDNALLLETNKQLKKENEEFGNQILEYIEKNNILREENEKLENELGKWKREAADCLRTRDEVRREKNKEINELKQQLQQAEIDKRRLAYKLEEKSNLPETPITDAMLVDDYNRLIKENDKLKEELSLEKAANEAQRKFIRMYAYAGKDAEVEFNYAIDEVGEVSYVIVEKEKYESLNDRSCMAHIHGKRYNTIQIVDMIHELEESNKNLTYKVKELEEQKTMVIPGKMVDKISKLEGINEQLNERIKELKDLKTPTIEYFADEEPSSKPKTDNVNHPSHYETGKFECIEVMQEVFGTAAVMSFCKCNAFKYTYRMDRKNGDEDVRKAIWYLNKYLELGENEDGGTNDGRKKQVPEGE